VIALGAGSLTLRGSSRPWRFNAAADTLSTIAADPGSQLDPVYRPAV
jgi:hypothetical protein